MVLNDGLSLKAAVSAILFASTAPVDPSRLAGHFEVPTDTILDLLDELRSELESSESGVRLTEANGKFVLTTKPEYGLAVASFLDQRRTASLSNAALETLAVAAYHQPVTKTYISQIRGVASGEVVESLVEKELLEEAGKLDLPGRPMSYRTTDKFLTVFGLERLEDLPSRESFSEPEPDGAPESEDFEQISLTNSDG